MIKWIIAFTMWSGFASARVVYCLNSRPEVIRVPLGRVTVLNFPTNPSDAIPGNGGFGMKTIRHDLVIKAKRLGVATDLFVYLQSRRCFFHLLATLRGDEIVFVRDPREKTIEVKLE